MVFKENNSSCHGSPHRGFRWRFRHRWGRPAESDIPVKRIALVGNPNVGKSVLFNALTGSYVTVSNYPGTTVEVAKGKATIDGEIFEIIDTPGMYSLLTITEEERVARKILLEEKPHLIIHVIDARNIERMLAMTVQLIEAGLPVILVVNIIDEAKRLGLTIDISLLSERLGIPVIGAAAVKRQGIEEIQKAILNYRFSPPKLPSYSKRLEDDIEEIIRHLSYDYGLSPRAVALLLLQRDEEMLALVAHREGERFNLLEDKLKEKTFLRRESFQLDLSIERKRLIKSILEGVFLAPERRVIALNERISQFLIRPATGIPVLLLVLYFGLYRFVGEFGAGFLVDFLEGTVFEENFNPWITAWVDKLLPYAPLKELLVGEYGIFTLALRYAVGIILPIVATFFLFFSLLEDSGYFPRLALLVDRLFKRIGLTGRAVIPMVLGFGCDTMATLVTRTLETTREKIIATLLLALAIPCSAQLGVILALLSQTPWGLFIWVICLVGVFLAVGFLAAQLLPGEKPIFYMELPPLRLPQISNILTKTLARMEWYFLEILPLFVLASLLL